ncbi:MAG: hypothetical protein JWN48_1931 [Myxococcaceae bacterium]|nr:hypothetical protein [Myxococcaceae bacterium]
MTESEPRSKRAVATREVEAYPGARKPEQAAGRPREGCEPLGAGVSRMVADAQLRDTFRTLFACELLDCTVGWPARTQAPAAWLRDGDVCIELARSPLHPQAQLALSLSAHGAALLADAVLGGRVASGIAALSGELSDAECGVLAYAAARLLATSKEPWVVRDVRPCRGSAGLATDAVVWPMAWQTSLATLDGALWLSPTLAEAPRLAARHRLEVSLFDQVDSDSLAKLAVGDVWVSEGASLTLTSEGLAGPVLLSVPGTSTRLHAQLRRNRVHCARAGRDAARISASHRSGGTSAAAAKPSDLVQVELVIGGQTVDLLELAELGCGTSMEVQCRGEQPGELRVDGVALATGSLLSWRGMVGLHIDTLCSSR